LVLAYNNAAAKELKTRLLERSKASELDQVEPPTILTFHALGRQILRDCEVTTYLSEFAEDPLKLEMWITEWITSYITSGSKSLFKFLQLLHEPTNPFDFKSKAEYDIYIRDNEYRTLQGERVRGYQELVIANWLFINGVKYTYEAPFVSKRRIRPEFDYRPDFYIIDRDIYLEHFGIDRNGKTRSDINAAQYNQEMLSKRKLHEECGTTLIETYHYYWTENRLEDELKQLMTIHGVSMKIKTPNELLQSLNNEGIILELAKRYLKCLQAIRVERIDKKSILQRLKNNNIFFASSYSDILDELHQSYKKKLLADNRIDFDDMIIRAIDLIDNGSFTPKWKFILVDEFQDISMARMELINSLIKKSDNPILTVVGDDWQSIYRFSGGKLELTTRFGTLVGSHCLTKLEKTYRYNSSIAKTAGTFVMQNPEQYVKQVTSHTQVENSTVYLIDTSKENNKTLETRVTEVINKIRQNDSEGSIAVLARYRYLLKNAQDRLK
ncbi:MAG: helicase IV, partial [Flavobacterium sp.]